MLGKSQVKSTIIEHLSHWLSAQEDIELALLFGSFAKNTAQKNSDIDLAIQSHTPLSSQQKKYFIESLARLTGRPIDIVDLHQAGEPLLGQILKYGQLLKGNKTQLATLALKHLYANEDFMPYIRRSLKERREKWMK